MSWCRRRQIFTKDFSAYCYLEAVIACATAGHRTYRLADGTCIGHQGDGAGAVTIRVRPNLGDLEYAEGTFPDPLRRAVCEAYQAAERENQNRK